jgi:hypothetical protein
VPSSRNPVVRGRLECCRMMLLNRCDPVSRWVCFPKEKGLLCKHLDRIYNELLLCSDGEELIGA